VSAKRDTYVEVDGKLARVQTGDDVRARFVRDLRAAAEAGKRVRVVAQRDGSSMAVMDDDEPADPRAALDATHGPAWSAGTPRTDEEAAVMLGQVEPRHALRERLTSRRAAAEGRVVLEPSPRVTPGQPMPEATMERAQWRPRATRLAPTRPKERARWSIEGGWLDAEVPPLCTLVARCEASGARVVLPIPGSDERYAAAKDRYGTLSAERAWLEINDPLGRDPLSGDPLGPEGADEAARRDHAGPYDEPRGWCAELASQT